MSGRPPVSAEDLCQAAGSGTAEPLCTVTSARTQGSALCLQGRHKCLQLTGETEKVAGGNIALDIFLP